MLRPISVLILLLLATVFVPEPLELKDSEIVSSTEVGNETLGWVMSVGGFSEDWINDIVPLANDTVAAGGAFVSSILIGENGHDSTQICETGSCNDKDGFIAFSNETNEWNFSIGFGSSGVDQVDSIAMLSDGDLIVGGSYCLGSAGINCNMNLGDLPTLSKEETDDEGNAFLARYDMEIGWIWAISIGNSNDLFVMDLYVDMYDTIHASVFFRDILDIDGTVFLGSSEPGVAVMMFDENGVLESGRTAMSDLGIDPFGGFCQNSVGETFLALTFVGEISFEESGSVESVGGSDIVIAKYNEDSWQWFQHAGGEADDRTYGCISGSDQSVQVYGNFDGNASFGNDYTGPSQWVDGYIATVDNLGFWDGVTTEGGYGYDSFNAAYRTASGSAIFAGVTTQDFTLGSEVLVAYDEDTSYYGTDIFLAEKHWSGTWDWALIGGSEGQDDVYEIHPSSEGGSLVAFSFEDSGTFGSHNITSVGWFDGGVWHYETDIDGDGILDGIDNCPRDANSLQLNFDADEQGNECDSDDDNDGIADDLDACSRGQMGWSSTQWTDHDSDGCRDSDEDFDDDNDTVFDHLDSCQKGPVGWISTPQTDVEGDGCSDIDSDGDGLVDQMDNCPTMQNEGQENLDNDNFGDICDSDEDGDGIENTEDLCPRDLAVWNSEVFNDWDRDGCLDSMNDFDDDNDGTLDMMGSTPIDECPKGVIGWNSSDRTLDWDQDGCHDDEEDTNDDNDGFEDVYDLCPRGLIGAVMSTDDADGDGCVDGVEDIDDDADGVLNEVDLCVRTPLSTIVDGDGCSALQADSDSDGVLNADDLCPVTAVGDQVDSDGCKIIENNDVSSGDEASSFGINQILIVLALLLAIVAGFMTFKPIKPQTASKSLPAVPQPMVQQSVVTNPMDDIGTSEE